MTMIRTYLGAIIEFRVLGVPVAKGRARHRHVKTAAGREFNMAYTPKKTADAEETFVARCLKFAPPTPLVGAIELELLFVLPVPKSDRKLAKRVDASESVMLPMPSVGHLKRPDLDNLEKLVKDAMNGVFWLDDKQVCDVKKRKIYGSVPRTEVKIRSFES